MKKGIKKEILGIEPCIHGARLAECAEKSGIHPDELIDFSVNLNPLAYPGICELVSSACRTIDQYPDNRFIEFRKAAAGFAGVKPDNIIPGNGSSEIIRLFAEVFIEKGDKVIIPYPTFSEYEFQCRLFGAQIVHIAKCGRASPYHEKISEILDPDTKAVFICNPDNPTGTLTGRDTLLRLAEKCSDAGVYLFIDEAFIELSDPEQSLAKTATENDYVVIARSLTKSFSIPGLRIGFGIASKKVARYMNTARLTWNVNNIANEVGTFLLNNADPYLSESRDYIRKEREWLIKKLGGIRGFNPMPSDTNFILVDIKDFGLDSSDLTEKMLNHGIIIRDCSSFANLANHIRLAVRTRGENELLLKAFTDVISEWGSELAEENINGAIKLGRTSSRVDCEYYPCHFRGQDCTFCFCPFYPCRDEATSGKYVTRSTGGEVWSCAGCDLIHRREIAEKVLEGMMKGEKLEKIWERVIRPYLKTEE